jgi:hypothetical protein
MYDEEDREEFSDCCGAYIIPNTDICEDCKEHCEPRTWVWDDDEETPEQMNESLRSLGY